MMLYLTFVTAILSNSMKGALAHPLHLDPDPFPINWEFAGPTTYVYSPLKLSSAAAVQSVVRGANNAWFIGSVNGGIWRTNNLSVENNRDSGPNNRDVKWTNVLDNQTDVTCTSISAMYFYEPLNILYAGCGGSTSSEQGSDWNVVNSGDWGGIMTSWDNGNTWNMTSGFPVNYYVTDILQVTDTTILVATQSHLYDRNDGGIWQSIDSGRSFQKRVFSIPTLTLHKVMDSGVGVIILATHAHRPAEKSISLSIDLGRNFITQPLPWKEGAIPFYTCAAIMKNGQVVVGGLIRLPGGLPNNTDSQMFVVDNIATLLKEETPLRKSSPVWAQLQQPTSMDVDAMPKDRMALLADPYISDLLYVAGNAEALAWRVVTTTGNWTPIWDEPDVVDGSIPHCDCRNFAWDADLNRLLLVTDGGIFAREQPQQPGGKWLSLNGDYSALELLSAHYDPFGNRYVMGAQDNCAIFTESDARSDDTAIGFVEGGGAITLVDSRGGRLFGTTQFLGVGTIYRDPQTKKRLQGHRQSDDDDDDDDGCGGLCFLQGKDSFIEVPLKKHFPEPSSFPFFVHPYTLNIQDPTRLVFWTNGTEPEQPSAFYEFSIPYSVRDKEDIGPPTKLVESPPGVMILDFVSGGYTHDDGIGYTPDPDLLIAISNSHLYVHNPVNGNSTKSSVMIERPLPVKFADPVTLQYDMDNDGARILGPLTHGRTVQMQVHPSDSRIIVVTGWQSIADNKGDEAIFITFDAGVSWKNITGNLRSAVGVVGKIRPGGMVIVELSHDENEDEYDDGGSHDGCSVFALAVGTSNGIAVCLLNTSKKSQYCTWTRLGRHGEFPIVLVADIDYQPISNRLVAATYGRGIYVVRDARLRLLSLFLGENESRTTIK